MMNTQLSKAVILAAGMGTRLRSIESERPKGFVCIDNQPLIERSIHQLQQCGIKQIIIVTGYKHEAYELLKEKYSFIQTVYNKKYDRSGSMYSLFCAKPFIDHEHFILLESDLLYEKRAIDSLQSLKKSSAILISGITNAGDEVYIATKNQLFLRMSKNKKELPSIDGELVGILKISPKLFDIMTDYAVSFFKNSLMLDYEDCLNSISGSVSLYCHKIEDLLWTEIDDPAQFDRAKKIIYPKIKESNDLL